MSRQQAIDSATAYFDQGTFQSTLARRVAIPTESQEPGKIPVLTSYLTEELAPTLKGLGFDLYNSLRIIYTKSNISTSGAPNLI